MNLLILDNYDSFTYNLAHILKNYAEVSVIRNDKISPDECLNYDAIVLSPGPGLPKDAGNMPEIIRQCAGKLPILGVCLGHQAIGEYLDGRLINLSQVFHGVKTAAHQTEVRSKLFEGINQAFEVGRYHSWSIAGDSINPNISVTSVDEAGEIMSIENLPLRVYGLQFHPESILTPDGELILSNFIKIVKQA